MARKRSSLSIETKIEIVNYHRSNPKHSHSHIAAHFPMAIGQKIARQTISSTIQQQDEILNCDTPKKKKITAIKSPEMEHLLSEWFQNAQKNLTISDNILKTKAK